MSNITDLDIYSTYQIAKTVDNQYIIANTNDEYIGRNILALGQWEPHIRQTLKRLIREGDNVIDIGANIGTHTIYMSKLVGEKGKVYAFEPNKINHDALVFSLMLNRCFNTSVYKFGVGEKCDIMYIGKEWKNTKVVNNFGAISLQTKSSSEEDEHIDIRPVDEFLFKNIRLIKIDAEGMEDKVIKGMSLLLNECKPYLIVEIHPPEVPEMVKIISSIGYKMFQLAQTIDFVAFPAEKEEELKTLFTK
jgi:FkbM family methyltransferase